MAYLYDIEAKPLNALANPYIPNYSSSFWLFPIHYDQYPHYFYQNSLDHIMVSQNQSTQNQYHAHNPTAQIIRPQRHQNTARVSTLIRRNNERPRQKAMWVPKREKEASAVPENQPEISPASDKGKQVIAFPSDLGELEKLGKTTIMIKNTPNQFRRRSDLLNVLNNFCKEENSLGSVKLEYDFVYLPMDFYKYWYEKRVANLGYAFVNFTTTLGAWKFYKHFNNSSWNVPRNNKICEVTLAKIQGKIGLRNQLHEKKFFCESYEYMPMMFTKPCNGINVGKWCNVGIRVLGPPYRPMSKKSPVHYNNNGPVSSSAE